MVEHPDEGDGHFSDKLKGQISATSSYAKKLMAEMLWALRLFPSNISPQTKRRLIREIWDLSEQPLREEPAWMSDSVLIGVGSAGQAYNRGVDRELRFLIKATGSLKTRSPRERGKILSQYDAFIEWMRSVPEDGHRQFRHMLRYFAFPDRVERIPTDREQRKILSAFGIAEDSMVQAWQHDRKDNRIDEALGRIRSEYETQYPGKILDFYHPPLRDQWHDGEPVKIVKIDLSKAGGGASATPSTEDAIQYLLDDSSTHAVLMLGPAGTGKTWTALRVAENYGDRKQHVQFHPAYSYEDFMEGLRPTANDDGQIAYKVRSGVFKMFCKKAGADPENNYLFIIDEINRGNVPKVMGELMYALEYRDKAVKLPYSGKPFSIPENVHILGTMNSSDRSVAMLDVALRRRFHFVELPPRPDLLSEIEVEGALIDLERLLSALNARILKAKGRHHLLGHSYFLPRGYPDIKSIPLSELSLRWFHQILPLLEEYFADDVKALREVIGDAWDKPGTEKGEYFVPISPDEMGDGDFVECLQGIASPAKAPSNGSTNEPSDDE